MLNIAITFDYELFFGKNNFPDGEILFEPTERVMALLGKYGIAATFFADVCSVEAHRSYSLSGYIDGFEAQLLQMQENGHDVQLHLHPNWLLSKYDHDAWKFDTTHYTLQSFGFDENQTPNAVSIIKNGKEYLEQLLTAHNEDYRCIAYRAGGYSVQPHDNLFRVLRSEGILIDASVCENACSVSGTISYDFRDIPKHLNWWITPGRDFSYCGKKEDNGLFEVPIPSQQNSIVKRLLHKDYVRPIKSEPMKGSFIPMPGYQVKKKNIVQRLTSYSQTYKILSFDIMASQRMIGYLHDLEKKHRGHDTYVAIVCHPKLIDSGVLANMEPVLKTISADERFRFVTMRDIYNQISKDN